MSCCQVCKRRPVEFKISIATHELRMCRVCSIDTAPAFEPASPSSSLSRAGFVTVAPEPVARLARVRGAKARYGLRDALAELGV